MVHILFPCKVGGFHYTSVITIFEEFRCAAAFHWATHNSDLTHGVDNPHAHTNQAVDFDNCYSVQKKNNIALLITQIFILYLLNTIEMYSCMKKNCLICKNFENKTFLSM